MKTLRARAAVLLLFGIAGAVAAGMAASSAEMWPALLLAAVLVAALAFAFVSSLASRVDRIADQVEQVRSGAPPASPPDRGDDELSDLSEALIDLTARNAAVVAELQATSKSLAAAAAEILASTSRQGDTAHHQTLALSETGATVSELRAAFQQAADRAQAVIDMARKSEQSTASGKASVEESVEAMQQIRDQVQAISRTIAGLVEQTGQIGAIIDAVNDLAEQSHILALNAAVEAAKAGEHGKGFGVVAREVRSLAERSKESTAQVRSILLDVEKASREALGAIDEGTRKTATGMDLAERAGQSIALLDGIISESSAAAMQIAASQRQQASGVDQIWQAIADIDRAARDNARGLEAIAATSTQLNALSERVRALVAQIAPER